MALGLAALHRLLISARAGGIAGAAAGGAGFGALAEVAHAEREPDRRAWHRAAAALAPDEAIAAELQRSAERARMRGGQSASAAFLTRAAELTPDPGRRVQRLLAAARAELSAGAPGRAEGLLERVSPLLHDSLANAQALQLSGEIRYALGQLDLAPAILIRGGAARLPRTAEAMPARRRSGRPQVTPAAAAGTSRTRTSQRRRLRTQSSGYQEL
jgi:hypothetical protein